MKQTLLFVLFLSTCISIQAQQPKSVSKFVFQTDNGGNIVKKVPVYDEEKTEDLKEKQRQLHVMSLREEIKITVSVSDKQLLLSGKTPNTNINHPRSPVNTVFEVLFLAHPTFRVIKSMKK